MIIMKKFLTLAIAVCLSVGIASAQTTSGSVVLKSTPTHAPTDTVVNAGVKNQVAAISVVNNAVSIQVDVLKISGTTGGFVRVYGSNTGVGYDRISTIKPDGSTGIDSLAVGNVSTLQTKIFRIAVPIYSYYRVTYTGTGTMSAKLNSLAVYRKQ